MTRSMPVAIAAAVLGAAGLAFATIPDADGVLHGCYVKSSGLLRVVEGAAECRPAETSIAWNATGPAGTPGAPGDRGPSDGFYVDQRGNFASQSLDPAAFKTLVTLSLPAGSFVANGVAALVGNAAFNTAQCRIATSTGSLGDLVQTTVGGAPNSFNSITLSYAFTLDAPAEASIVCRASSNSIATQPSTMTAIQVGTLTDLSN